MRAGRRFTVLVLLIVACDRSGVRGDSAGASAAGAATGTTFPAELGSLLAVAGDSDRSAVVIVPATLTSTGVAASQLRLFRLAGDSATLVRGTLVPADTSGCEATLNLAGQVPDGWSIAMTSDNVVPLRPDSIESLAPRDSGALAAAIARVAPPPGTAPSRFDGLPMRVLKAYRYHVDGRTVVVATTLRRIPQEATPLEQRSLLVLEAADDRSSFAPAVYTLRSEGTEDTAEHFTPLAVVRSGPRTFVIIEREQENGSRYEIVERDATGGWRLVWSYDSAC